MESLGEKLRITREGKGIDFEQAGKDTKIAIRYLQALEVEDFSGFPGEAYITGFLRNYGEYLELDTQELFSLYRALKMQEQPVPVEQLLKKPPVLPKILIGAAAAVLVLGAAGAGVYFFLTRPKTAEPPAPPARSPVVYTMEQDNFERRFYPGDSILVPSAENQFRLELAGIGEAVTLNTPGGEVALDLSREVNIDLENSGAPGLRVYAVDFVKNSVNDGAQLRFELLNAAPPAAAQIGAGETAEPAVITAQSASNVIFTSPNPYPFTLQSSFQNYCMFRWEILMERDRRGRNERYYQRSEALDIQAQNGIRLWISNAQAVKFQVIGGGRTVPVEIGGAGEVVVAEIKWIRDEDNRYRLVVARMETGTV